MRLFSCPAGEKKRVYSALLAFLCSYAFVTMILSASKFKWGPEKTFHDVVWEVPFILLLTALAFWPEGDVTRTTEIDAGDIKFFSG
jgi:hypothetical protein